MTSCQDWIGALSALRDERVPCVLVVVAGVKGSAPREEGARMIVAGDGIRHGTIGGGRLEQLATEHAQAMLTGDGAAAENVEFPLGETAGQCCGGAVTLFFERHEWRRREIVIFGAGHVGQALGGLAGYLDADLRLVDSRTPEELHPKPSAELAARLDLVDAPEGVVDEIEPGASIVVMTHSHAIDQEILEACLPRIHEFAYVGLIGSERKWARFQERLAAKGFSDEAIGAVRSPIGLVRGSKEPHAIALSVAAELLGVPLEV
ncbi:MAG: xanthine dehydrogenase accessory protein XdhC [Planctomycetes bacterium]|nr:xanthine dehydrogenase accessory protein XdhC [Planctomycetota bacterium]